MFMTTRIYIIILIGFVFLFGRPEPVPALTDSLPVYRMGEIVVTAKRLPMISTAALHEIDSKTIARLDIHQPADALKFAPGLHVYTMSKNETVFNLRGFEQRQISVFYDGVPVSLPYDGQIDLSQFSGDQIETIRVSRGVAPALYGANTLGGSVNIITNTFDRPGTVDVRLEGSDQQRYFASLAFHRNLKKLRFNIKAAWDRAAGFELPQSFRATPNENGNKRDNSAHEKKSAAVNLLYPISGNHEVGLNYTLVDNWYHIAPNTKTERVRYWRFPEWRKNMVSLNVRNRFSEHFNLRSIVYLDQYYNLLKSYDDASYASQDKRYAWNSAYDDYTLGTILYPTLTLWSRGRTNAMIAYKYDVHRESFRDSGYDSYKMATFSVGLDQDIRIGKNNALTIGADLNYLNPIAADQTELRDPLWLLNGQILFQHQLTPKLAVHTALGKKSRYPTLKELYSERLGRSVPNPDLQAEHSFNTEIGISINIAKTTTVQAALFYNTLRDLIVQRQLGQDSQQLQNTGKALIQGAELDFSTNYGPVNLVLNYTFLKANNLSYNRPNAHLPNRPAHQFNVIGRWQIHPRLHLQAESRFVAGQYYEHPDRLTWEPFDDYLVINLKTDVLLRSFLRVYLRVDNAADALYENDFGVPMPGRQIISGLRLNL